MPPVDRSLRLLVGAEAVFGQIYLAVVVARLVAMHVTSGEKNRQGTGLPPPE